MFYGILNRKVIENVYKKWNSFYQKNEKRSSRESLVIIFLNSLEGEELEAFLYLVKKRKIEEVNKFDMDVYLLQIQNNEGTFNYNESEFVKIIRFLYKKDIVCSLSYIGSLIYLSSCDSFWTTDKSNKESVKVEIRMKSILDYLLEDDRELLQNIVEEERYVGV